jgi:5'-3' exonuclease
MPLAAPRDRPGAPGSLTGLMVVHLIDGTYELFRQFYGRQRGGSVDDKRFGAVIGVLHTVLQMLETGTTHVGVATDHVIESFRNDLWPGYKTGLGVDPVLRAQFEPLELALAAMGVTVWPMVELEADDALGAAARSAMEDDGVVQVRIWTPDKDLAQCVRESRVVQIDRRANTVRDAAGVREKFGVDPPLIPDLLALVGDSADGYPGIRGIGKVGAARLLNQHGPIEAFPPDVLGDNRDMALLFKDLATLRTGVELFDDVDSLRWRGPTEAFAETARLLEDGRLAGRANAAIPA